MDPDIASAVARVAYGDPVNVTELCRSLGISRKTFYKYLARYRAEGVEGFFPRSRRPRTSPSRVSAEVEDAIIAARKTLDDQGWDCGAISIWYRLSGQGQLDQVPSRATIHRVLARRGMITPAPAKRPRRRVRRFARPCCNDLWQMDGFEVALADGTPATVLQIIDDCSRLDLACHAATGETSQAAWDAFSTAAARYGLPRQFLTDNSRAFSGHRYGWESDLAVNLRELGVEPITSRPGHPQTCGKNERAHRTTEQWLARRPTPATLDDLQHLLETYRHSYNNDRPHQAHQGLTPQQRWDITEHTGPASHPLPLPLNITHPTVAPNGTIAVGNAYIGLGRTHAGTPTTIFRTGDHTAIFIGHRLAGTHTLDPTRRYQPLDQPVTEVLRQNRHRTPET